MCDAYGCDVIFYSHASAKTGFGHASRCVKTAQQINSINQNIEIGFCGNFDKPALQFMSELYPVKIVRNTRALVGIYDRMDDFEHPEAFDSVALNKVAKNSSMTIFMANGLVPPSLPVGVKCIGYKMGGNPILGPNILWGLEYAPTDFISHSKKIKREDGRALVVLGGDTGAYKITKVLNGLGLVKEITDVDVLLSPVNSAYPELSGLRPDQRVNIYERIPEIGVLLLRSSLVIASYGHFAYEALASGATLCLFGQKRFQALYANHLADAELCVSGGLLDEIDSEKIATDVRKSLQNSAFFKSKTKMVFFGSGIKRVAEMIVQQLEVHQSS